MPSSTPSQPNRRDWFRLFKPPESSTTRRESTHPTVDENDAAPRDARKPISNRPIIGASAAGLQPVAAPVNHDGMDLSKLPPMREALLDSNEVQQLFADVAAYGSDILLMERQASAGRQPAVSADSTTSTRLQLARDGILSDRIQRIQIRYRWSDASWIDTLETRPDGFRLVRIAHR